jgi:hypothetical protein
MNGVVWGRSKARAAPAVRRRPVLRRETDPWLPTERRPCVLPCPRLVGGVRDESAPAWLGWRGAGRRNRHRRGRLGDIGRHHGALKPSPWCLRRLARERGEHAGHGLGNPWPRPHREGTAGPGAAPAKAESLDVAGADGTRHRAGFEGFKPIAPPATVLTWLQHGE